MICVSRWVGALFALGTFPVIADEEPSKLVCKDQWINALDLSPDGKLLASGSSNGSVTIWDLEKEPITGKLLKNYESPVTALVWSPDGKSLVVGTWDGTLVKCSLEKGNEILRYEGHKETITTLKYSPDGDYLASGSADDRLIVWDEKTAEDLLTMHQGNEYDVTTLAFSPDGETIATGDGENQLKLWDAGTGEEVRTIKGHQKPVSQVIYDSQGRLISGSWDHTIRVMGKEKTQVLKGHKGEITALEVGGKDRLYSASEDRTVRLWDLEKGEALRTFGEATESIRGLAVWADGRVFVGSKDLILYWKRK